MMNCCALSKKKGATSASFPKMLAWTNKTTLLIETFLLDADSAGNDTKSAAKAIKNSIAKLHLEDDFILIGGTTDSGGGGTKEALK